MTGARRSLFWTIAGVFLLTAVLGTLVQAIVATAVLKPLEARDARARAELVVSSLAVEIAAGAGDPAALDSLFDRQRTMLGPRFAWIAYRPQGRDTIFTAPPGRGRLIRPALGLAPAAELARPPEPGRPVPRWEVLARRTVRRGAETLGELAVVRPIRSRGALGVIDSPTTLLLVPIALIASGAAGLVMVRLLVRRLRGIETLAARVAEGDLSVRIADTSGDEIGLLAERLDRMTERLADARDRLEETERQRRQLFADITHELATPLTSIRGLAETLLDPRVTTSGEERTRYVRGVLEESRRLDRLIRDLFELASLEAGASPLAPEPLDWVALCRNTAERFAPRFRQAGLALVWRGPLEEAWIEADGHRMEEVLENLLVNALRYVPEGGAVELSLEPAGADRFRLTVSDDGRGVPPAELPHVFERFYRSASAARDGGGSGLGLAIVREIVLRHGGTVRADARTPHGLAIVVEVPARAPQPAPRDAGFSAA